VAGGPSRSILSIKGGSKNEEVLRWGKAFRDLTEATAQPGAPADARGSPRPYQRSGAGAADLVSLGFSPIS
jgi:hypothetical protein